MNEIKYTLLSEGTSDKALMPILTWLLQTHLVDYAIQAEWADLGRLPNPPKRLSERIRYSYELYPCDVLFIHRDADSQGRHQRASEISAALEEIQDEDKFGSAVCVIPLRMTEAWLLFDEIAIRRAAENPRNKQPLNLPDLDAIEQLADPKTRLYRCLERASGASGRRLKKFKARLSTKVQRISETIEDFSPLRRLNAFQIMEADVQKFAEQYSVQH